ncbi:MAG: S41 family peptidase [Halobacteriovoraceae bacterium]|nr:S41 family peptidase [Halobacteriovoraceae bacterium]
MKFKIAFFILFFTSPAWTVADKSRFEKLEAFSKVLYLIESQYYRKVEVEKLVEGAIKGMMSTLDPHSSFLSKILLSKMQEDTQGEFGGVGIEVSQKDGILVIITPIDDTPAFRAGLKAGDRIVEIDHDSTIGLSIEQAVEKMKGRPNTSVTLGILREGEDNVKEFVIRRERIRIHPVKSNLIDKNFIYVKLIQFQKRSAEEIIDNIKKLRRTSKKAGGVKGIVLDLRSNPGGLLDEAVSVSSIFLKDGVVVSTEGRDPKNRDIRYVRKTGHKELALPMVVLINGSSASASEIVAGALQDSNRAIIMGNQSFGKGTVQTIAKIDEDRGIKLTIAQYMTPSGKRIQAEGIKPDIELEQLDSGWVLEHKKRGSKFIREKDLRNHLSATVETAKEKKQRLEKERKDRLSRRKKLKELRKKKKSNNIAKRSNPEDDFQVMQAVNYLRSFEVFKKMKKTTL